MASFEELRSERQKKLARLRGEGINPYPNSSLRDTDLAYTVTNFVKLSKKKSITLAGRVTALRGQGAIIFFDLFDGTGKIQGLLKKGETESASFSLFTETVDIGDFVEIAGKLFTTNRKEKTILAKRFRMLSKSLRPLPDKWHGLENVEERFRRRYLDTLMSEEVRMRFVLRSAVIRETRRFLDEEGFLEVETPTLHALPGGALAEPFKTHHNTLEMDLYLRVAPELYLKELLVGGFPKVYELGKSFRNEGIDVTHNPEFTMLEFYESFADSKKMMKLSEALLKSVLKKIIKKPKFEYQGEVVDFSKKFAVITYENLLKRYALIPEPFKASQDELSKRALQLAVPVNPTDSQEKILDNIYKRVCRPKLVNPTFIIDYPVSFSPFAKRKEGSADLLDRFQLVVGGLELVNAFSELNDPEEQKARYDDEERKKKRGEKDISPSDDAYLEAIEYGLPPAGGAGLGIDRLVMLLSGTTNIREVILFPLLRPKR